MGNRNSLRVHSKDSNQVAMEKNEKLLEIIRKLEKENKKLKSQYRTIEAAWEKTEKKYKEAVEDVPLKRILDHMESGKPINKKKLRRQCNKCLHRKLKKIEFDGFCVVICDQCGYRNRIDDRAS